ncbi:hypothetical protein A0128_06965 [Leptospira tipperaryensis]|uniref:Uncharacterized protein n=1 Tax=Leptospira tipperaryensis TaxID=2564040 RepID=A0A1D7UVH1_9LEPT|nr:hypothetical protein [Leptospira tipperaryensis]AOP33610.1 hypothetical protein A0128_06965 [Leptospira tipperaryensis]
MKKIIITICILGFFWLCNPIRVKRDSFKNLVSVTMDLDHSAYVEGFTRSASSRGTQYSREIKNDKNTPTAIYFKLFVSNNLNALTNEAYIKIDDKITKLELIETSVGSQVVTEKTNDLNIKTGKIEEKSSTSSMRVLTGKMILNSELEKAILNSQKLQYRLYAQSEPIELTVSSSQLNTVKEFLSKSGQEAD